MSLLAALGDSASSSLPRHVAIIMDGNGRWAQNRGKMRVSGHKAGVKSVREAVAFAARAKMEALTLFAFSSENWRRPEGEVNALMELFMTVLGREVNKLHSNGIRLKVIGDTARFSERLQAKIAKAEALTAGNPGTHPQHRRQLWRSMGHSPGGPQAGSRRGSGRAGCRGGR